MQRGPSSNSRNSGERRRQKLLESGRRRTIEDDAIQGRRSTYGVGSPPHSKLSMSRLSAGHSSSAASERASPTRVGSPPAANNNRHCLHAPLDTARYNWQNQETSTCIA